MTPLGLLDGFAAAYPCLIVVALVVAVPALMVALSAIWAGRGSVYQDIYRKDRRP
jgi:hypothetical protein